MSELQAYFSAVTADQWVFVGQVAGVVVAVLTVVFAVVHYLRHRDDGMNELLRPSSEYRTASERLDQEYGDEVSELSEAVLERMMDPPLVGKEATQAEAELKKAGERFMAGERVITPSEQPDMGALMSELPLPSAKDVNWDRVMEDVASLNLDDPVGPDAKMAVMAQGQVKDRITVNALQAEVVGLKALVNRMAKETAEGLELLSEGQENQGSMTFKLNTAFTEWLVKHGERFDLNDEQLRRHDNSLDVLDKANIGKLQASVEYLKGKIAPEVAVPRDPNEPTEPRSDLERAQSRLAQQRKQLEKWKAWERFGTHPQGLDRRQIIAHRESVASGVVIWEAKVAELEAA